VAFDRGAGGVVCTECQRGERLSATAVTTLQLLSAGRVRDAIQSTPAPAVAELEGLATRLVEHHIERRLRSADVLARDLER
jgi:hypothetical protein